MGLFDEVLCSGPEFVCSEGHDLTAERFQTKDLGCTMGTSEIVNGRLVYNPGNWGSPEPTPFIGRLYVGAACTGCPAFVQAKTCNLIDRGVTFELEIIDDVVRKVTRQAPDTLEAWILETKGQKWMEGCYGPIPHEEAHKIHLENRFPERTDG